jgi:alanine racemase
VEESLIYPLPNRAWLDVSVSALRDNALTLQQRAGAPLIPMVKANAYGVGAAGVVRALESLDPLAYGVATVDEGESLREMGVGRDIIVFTPLLESEYSRAQAAHLSATLGSSHSIEAWAKSGAPYHLSIDTGMNRAGVAWREAASVRQAVLRWPPVGAFTHFHSAEKGDESVEEQVERFFSALDEIGVAIPMVHADNSAAAARGAGGRAPWGAIRPGVFLYGVSCGSTPPARPVVSLRARVVDLRWIEPGDSVSYDAAYVSKRRERIATVAAGYGDGYPRALSNRGVGLLNGLRVSQRGLVTMDMTMFDVTEVSCELGDVVTLIDGDADRDLGVEAVAENAGMSPYELLTGLASRLERRFNED